MKVKNLSYTTRIWLLSVLVSPILLGLVLLITGDLDTNIQAIIESIMFYGLMIFFGALFSLPAYGVFILTNELVFQNISDIFRGKLLASFLGLVICYVIAVIFNVEDELHQVHNDKWAFLASYPFTIFFGTWYFEPNPKI